LRLQLFAAEDGILENQRRETQISTMNPDLVEARNRVENIAKHLPSSISVASLGVLTKAPYLLLSTREALIWRTEELARCHFVAWIASRWRPEVG
jgi:hypothetical protein